MLTSITALSTESSLVLAQAGIFRFSCSLRCDTVLKFFRWVSVSTGSSVERNSYSNYKQEKLWACHLISFLTAYLIICFPSIIVIHKGIFPYWKWEETFLLDFILIETCIFLHGRSVIILPCLFSYYRSLNHVQNPSFYAKNILRFEKGHFFFFDYLIWSFFKITMWILKE